MKKLSLKYTLTLLLITFVLLVNVAGESKVNFAVLGFKNGTGVSSGETDILADRLRVNLFRTGKVIMMERSQMDEILREQGFQASGACNDAECAVEMGQMLGVQRVVGGSIGKLGSLFLVNLRVIDVETAKILKVVSRDISGGIEGVVKVLPNLADELVDEIKNEATPVTVEPVVKEEPKEEPEKIVVTEEQEKEDFDAATPGKKAVDSKNKNVGGIRIAYSLYPGEIKTEYYDSEYFDSYEEIEWLNDEYLDNDSVYLSESRSVKFRANLAFMIAVGKFISIDIGPGFGFLKQSSDYSLYFEDDLLEMDYINADVEQEIQVLSPNVSFGVNFVKRFSPLKINIGFIVDLNFNLLKYSDNWDFDYVYTYYDDINNYVDRAFVFSTSFGPRAGVEILAGKKVGFSLDYIFKYDKLETSTLDARTYSYIAFESILDNKKWQFKMPTSSLTFGINFYKD